MKKQTKPIRCAYIFGCNNTTLGGARGFCIPHYACYYQKVKRGGLDWEKIKEMMLHRDTLTPRGKEFLKCRDYNLVKYTRGVYPTMPKENTPPENLI